MANVVGLGPNPLPLAPIGGGERSIPSASPPADRSSFADAVQDFVRETDASQKSARAAADAYANGQSHDLHGTMISLSQAEISLRLLANARNRVIEAYREIMRMGA